MLKYSTIVELLQYRAKDQPHKSAYIFLPDGENISSQPTYQDLDHQARGIASYLQSLGITNTRVLLVYPYHNGLEFIMAFFGCLYGNVVAVTNNPPRHAKSLLGLQERAISSQTNIVLTTEEFLSQIQAQSLENPEIKPILESLQWIATDIIPTNLADSWQEPQINSDTLAYMQYTSGSTGIPKGVMVTHGNMLHNSEVICQGFEHHSDTKGVMWLPFYHDMGLIGGTMQPIYAGFTMALMSPISLIQNPLRWLKAISRFEANTSGGPNFAYDLLCKIPPQQYEGLNLDLSSWDLAFSGAEPVRAETLEIFVEKFSPYGFRKEAFYPCYGMAESTLFISGGLKKDSPRVKYVDNSALGDNKIVEVSPDSPNAKAIVGCGKAWLDDKIAIADAESLIKLGDNQVGEIWVSGNGIAKGYWNQVEETNDTFNAYFKDTKEGPFLRTGDLGFLNNGELFITGRIKEIIIIWGRNLYPQHIEDSIQKCHPALRLNCGAVFSVEVDGEEKLVIAQEIERSYLRNLAVDEVIEAIRKVILEDYLVDVYGIALLKTASLPKTTSGKIQRRACREMFLDNTLNLVGKWLASDISESGVFNMAQNI